MKALRGVAVLTAGIVTMLAAGCGGGSDGPETIAMTFSKFNPQSVTVKAGEPVTFVLDNRDPIEHEWIVGTLDVHNRHRFGTEPYHDEIPTEVTVPALTAKQTTITFEQPGEYLFICHLPGHEAYGMRGTVYVQ